jgi:uncharacterized membrane-anchored protein
MSKIRFIVLALVGCAVFAAPSLHAQTSDTKRKLGLIEGPTKAKLKDIAQVEVPEGYVFVDGNGLRALLKRAGEPTSGNELGLLRPTNHSWSVIFEFSAEGYVKDDDKNSLNADKILAEIKASNAEANKERVRNGNAPLEVVGWEQPPKYDETTHNLEWCIRGTSEDHAILNYNTRLLGRKGVMEVVLIVDPEKLPETMPAFRNVLANYTFQTGQTYAEYRPGDKVAKYGLAALVVGGAAVGAAKLGLFTSLLLLLKKGFKLVIVAVVAVIAAIKKFFAKIFGRRQTSA